MVVTVGNEVSGYSGGDHNSGSCNGITSSGGDDGSHVASSSGTDKMDSSTDVNINVIHTFAVWTQHSELNIIVKIIH